MVTLPLLHQLGAANAGLLTVHYAEEARPIVVTVINTIVEDPYRRHFIDMLVDIPQAENEYKGTTIKTYGALLTENMAHLRDAHEFKVCLDATRSLYNLWVDLEPDAVTMPESALIDHEYLAVGREIAGIKAHEFGHGNNAVVAVDVTQLSQYIAERLRDGSWFADRLYERGVQMTPDGTMTLQDDEWATLFGEDDEIQ